MITIKHLLAAAHANWSSEVQLEPIAVSKGTNNKLTEQPFILQAIIRHGIDQATDHILLRKNWPEENNWTTYNKELVLKGCQDKDIT